MKKILVVCRNASTYHAPIFRGLANKSDLRVLYIEKDGYINKYNKEYRSIIKKDFSMFKNYKYKFLPKKKFFFRYIIFYFTILSLIKDKKINNILIFGYDSIYSWIALLTAKTFKIKVLWRGEAILNKNSILKSFLKKIILKFFFNLCDEIFYSCKKNKYFIENYTNKKTKSYPCSVDNHFFRNKFKKYKKNKKKIIKKYNLKNNTFKIISVCRLTRRKNISELLHQVFISKLKNIEILIVGDGPERDNLKNLSKKYNLNCKFFGFMNHDESSKLLSVANIYCLLSKYDASPKSVNEALNFKLPVIINKSIGTADDVVKNYYNGIVLKNNKRLATNLKKIISNKKLLLKMKNNCYKVLDKNFSHETCIKNILNYAK